MNLASNTPIRFAVLISHPIQYWVPVYRHLATNMGCELKVFYVGENGAADYFDTQFNQRIRWDVPLTEGYEHEFLRPGFILPDYSFNRVDAKHVVNRLRAFSPDYVWVNGYAHKVIWRALLGLRQGARFIVNSDSNLADSRAWFKRTIKRAVVSFFYRQVYAAISCSPSNLRYLQHYNVPAHKIVESVMPVDIQRLQSQAEAISETEVKTLKIKLGIPLDHKVVLFAGKLIEHKRPQDVISLLAELRSQGLTDCHAVIVGSGIMQSQLESLIKEFDLQHRVHMLGFVNQTEIAKYFAISDLLVFPSEREPYGVIATEVLPFGLPILAANNIGAVGASIIADENALLYPCGDVKTMAQQAVRILNDKTLHNRFSQASIRLAQRHDANVLAKDLLRICRETLPLAPMTTQLHAGQQSDEQSTEQSHDQPESQAKAQTVNERRLQTDTIELSKRPHA